MTLLRAVPPALVASLLFPVVAHAQANAAIAEQLFRDGRQLLEAGKTDDACEKFAASQRLAPAIGTQLNLALCREKQGKTASAWSIYADVEAAAQRAGDSARARFAHSHAALLSGQLRKVVIEVPAPPPGMAVMLDGTQLPAGALGTEIPLDPGEHDLVVTAPGKKKWEQSHLALGPSATTVHVRVELEDEASSGAALPPPPPEPIPPPAAAPPSSEAPPATSSSPANVKLIAGVSAGGAGVALLGVATYYWVTALARKNDERDYPAGSQAQLAVYNQAKDAQTDGFIVGGIGIAALGAGAVLIVLSRPGHHEQAASTASWHLVPDLGPGRGGALVQGTF